MPTYFPFRSDDESYNVDDCILPQTEFHVSFLGSTGSLDDYIQEINISASRGVPISGSIKLKDNFGYIAEDISSFNIDNPDYRAHGMNSERTLNIELTQGVVTRSFTHLIPGDPSWDGFGTTTLTFTDMTPLIDKDNQSLPNIVYQEGDTDETSHTVIADISGLAGKNIVPEFSPYEINTFRMNNTNLLSALDELQAPRQAYRKWDGDVLKLETLSVGGSQFSIIDRKHIPENGITFTKDTSNLRTYFKYFRNIPQESVLGSPRECTGQLGEESPCVGRVVKLTFNRPARWARVFTEAYRGSIEDGVFYDESENPISVIGGGSGGVTEYMSGPLDPKAASWLGTYVPEFILGADEKYVPSWRVWAIGGDFEGENVPEGFDVDNTITDIEAIYGARPEYRDLASELLLNEVDAVSMLEAIELEIKWSINKISLNTPFLFPAEEGEFVTITHYRHELDSELCLVNGWSYTYSTESGWSNSYDLRYHV